MFHENIKVAFLSAEVAPFAKVGGLGDVAGALPKALYRQGIDARVFMPLYGSINIAVYHIRPAVKKVTVPAGDRDEHVSVWQAVLPDSQTPVYFIKHKFFSGKEIYKGGRLRLGEKYTRGASDIQRFSFFTRAVLAACEALDFQPDIVHAQDWHTALAAQMIRTRNFSDNFFARTKTIYTIHNLANQGITDPEIIAYAKVNPDFPIVKADARNGDINCMVQGILASDVVTTVSPRYAEEILHHYQGAGLDVILRKRRHDLYGILNGIDTDVFNPQTDALIKYRYDRESIANKTNNKVSLQKRLGLPPDPKTCLAGFVSRLVWQKGMELLDEELIAKANCQFVILGTGQKEYEALLEKLAKKYPKKFKAHIGFDLSLAQQIYAGSDIFLVPSRFEPCGLTQMIAMRYGSVPIVRATGGLADTVKDLRLKISDLRLANGFVFKEFSAWALERAIQRALKVYYEQPRTWQKLQKNGMKEDFSWHEPAQAYVRLYRRVMRRR